MFTILEPRRTDQARHQLQVGAGGHGSLRDAVGYVRNRWRGFGTLFIGSAAVVTMGSLTFWNVALFDRTWGWNVRDVGIATGVLFFAGGPIGTLMGIRITYWFSERGHRDATMRALWFGLALAACGFATYPVMPSAAAAIAALFVAFVGQAAAAAAGPASLTLIAPGQIKSQGVALYYLFIGVFGQLLGPPPVGLMTDLFGDPASLRYAMTIEAAVVGSIALLIVGRGLRHYRAAAEELEQLVETGHD
jgi:hypothetical protein